MVRIFEVLHLDRHPYTGWGFAHVQIKGGQVRDVVPVQGDARAVLEEWLVQQSDSPGSVSQPAVAGGSAAVRPPPSSAALPARPRPTSKRWPRRLTCWHN